MFGCDPADPDSMQVSSPPAANTAPGYALPPVSTLTKGGALGNEIPGQFQGTYAQMPSAAYTGEQWITYPPQGFLGGRPVFVSTNYM